MPELLCLPSRNGPLWLGPDKVVSVLPSTPYQGNPPGAWVNLSVGPAIHTSLSAAEAGDIIRRAYG